MSQDNEARLKKVTKLLSAVIHACAPNVAGRKCLVCGVSVHPNKHGVEKDCAVAEAIHGAFTFNVGRIKEEEERTKKRTSRTSKKTIRNSKSIR